MQFLQGKSATEFGHTLGTLLTGAKQVVVAGDAPPRDLEMLDERVRSRLSGGLVVPITGFDLDLRRAIVAAPRRAGRSRASGVHFPPAVHRLHRPRRREPWPRSRRRGQPARRRQPADQRADHRARWPSAPSPTSSAPAKRAASASRTSSGSSRATTRCRATNCCRSRRSRDVVRPRQIAMYLAKSLTSRSLPEIGRRFGGRDHTTVLHSVRKVEQMMKDDGDLGQEIELLKRMLEE